MILLLSLIFQVNKSYEIKYEVYNVCNTKLAGLIVREVIHKR